MALPRRQTNRTFFNRGLIAESGIVPPGMQYMRDVYSFKLSGKPQTFIMEDVSGKKVPVMRVNGLFQECEVQNANGRVYPRSILAEATRLIQDDLSRRAVYGELDHPQDAKIHMDRISHVVTKAFMDGNKIMGEAEILDNQIHGAALRGLFERRCEVGISSRGIGDMEMRESAGKQYYEVMPGYQFVTWDAVADPSVSGATLQIVESLNRKLKPLNEARRTATRRGNLFEASTYEPLLVKAVHDFFDIKPILPTEQPVKRKYFDMKNR